MSLPKRMKDKMERGQRRNLNIYDDYVSKSDVIAFLKTNWNNNSDANDAMQQSINEIRNLPERPKARWIKVGGYATPGGDPVWKCSNCGKGVHVYGIEANSYQSDIADGQWIACPNCGSIMETL